ncbi:hypothetical protein PSN45_002187 [Yamadazyma tenuis]|uniref:Uncharacterized protein n=1 Tax=Candida tenuis (strain ATCC 10573 / BCRC 21748 / CBS 615 / JCM 9827 / NBRC 10315 / NRRL Y-1498 / VKM Y-70) TaxID=590646 RepID=G3BFP9_CANTC|nr:uncharacterized protein CANTEDRAFT_95541 [Yamadazyma tenuis ATCC 10573]EGV60075.1 hypothetical protein CANTEDRAFT_95541 [Yamadazyma tenuis ATCC 10573]WEJ94693.1 hypothetical protein PSN45_002187 [Yamadazyma tenuis]
MKLSTLALSCFSLFTCIHGETSSPSFVEYGVDVVERQLSIPSLVSSLLDGFDVADIISDVNFEKIAGWADDLLNEGDNIDILDKIFVSLKNTKILPNAGVYLVTHNSTLQILEDSLPTILSVTGNINTTDFWVALDRSGLAYSVVAGALESDEFLPSVLSIAKKLIKSGGINLESLLEQAEKLIERDTIYAEFESEVEPPMTFATLYRRDNIEDLLETVMESIERSGLLNDTIMTLLTDEEFQDATVVLIQGALQNIGSLIQGSDFSALSPILQSLWDSNMLQDILEEALQDKGLRTALTTDLASMLKQGSIKETDLVSKSDKAAILAKDEAMSASEVESSVAAASATEASSSSKASSSSTETSDSEDGASLFRSSPAAVALGVLVPVGMFLI